MRGGVGRREFLAAVACLPAAAALAGCGGALAVPVSPRDGRVRVVLADHPALARGGGGLTLDVDGLPAPLHVLAREDAPPLVLSAVCTHLGCIVERRGDRLVCPCHGSTYDAEGTVLAGPAPRPLRRVPSRVVDGVLEIDLAARGGAGGAVRGVAP